MIPGRQDLSARLAPPVILDLPEFRVRLARRVPKVRKVTPVISVLLVPPVQSVPPVPRGPSARRVLKVRKGIPATSDRKVLPVLLEPRGFRVRLARPAQLVPRESKGSRGRLVPPDLPDRKV